MKKLFALFASFLVAVNSLAATITVWQPGGDLATSSTATNQQLSTTGVSANSYVMPNLTVDAKGRITSAAVSVAGDITGKFSGTCDNLAYLRGDGTCQLISSITVSPAGSNTQVQFNNSGAFGASSNFTWNSGSNLLNLGASTTPGTYSVGQYTAMTISGTAMAVPSFSANSNIQGNVELHSYTSATPAAGTYLYGVRTRGTIAAPTTVASGDNLMTLGGAGYDGTNYTWGAHIHFLADGTPSAGVLPGALDLQTTPAASGTPTSRLKLDSTGAYLVNGSAGTAGNLLRSAGTGAAAGWSTGLTYDTGTTILTVPKIEAGTSIGVGVSAPASSGRVQASGGFFPGTDLGTNLGSSGLRFNKVYTSILESGFGSYLEIDGNGSPVGYLRTDTANTFVFQPGTGGYAWKNNGNTSSLMTLSDGGNLVLAAPSSGNSFSVAGIGGQRVLDLTNSANTGVYMSWSRPNKTYIAALDINNSGGTDWTLYDATRGASTISVGGSGNVTVNAPSSGVATQISAVAGANSRSLALDVGSATSENLMSFGLNGTTKLYYGLIGTANNLINGSAQNDTAMRLETANFLLSTNAGTSIAVKVASTGGVQFGSPTGGDPGAGALNTAGDIKINNVSVCRSDGTNCPGGGVTTKYGSISDTGSCVETSSQFSCTRTGTGAYQITFTSGYSSSTAYNCTASYANSAGGIKIIAVERTSSSVFNLLSYNTSGSAADANTIDFICVGT